MNLVAGRKEKPVGVRLPAVIRQLLDESAARNGRSRNSEIVVRLALSLGLRNGEADSKTCILDARRLE